MQDTKYKIVYRSSSGMAMVISYDVYSSPDGDDWTFVQKFYSEIDAQKYVRDLCGEYVPVTRF